jgi:hypothetical protein
VGWDVSEGLFFWLIEFQFDGGCLFFLSLIEGFQLWVGDWLSRLLL